MTDLAITTIEHETDIGVVVETLAMTSVFTGGTMPGPQGIQGPIGPDGIQGTQGVQGTQGIQGVAGDITFAQTLFNRIYLGAF